MKEKYNIDYLKVLSNKEISKVMLNSFDIHDYQIINRDITKEEVQILDSMRLEKDDIKHYFDVDKEKRIYTFPYLKENSDLKFFGHETVPAKGFSWDINAKKHPNPFGIIDVVFRIDKIERNETDTRFSKRKAVFIEKNSYFYDYDNQIYEQVNFKNKTDNKTKEYIERQEAYSYGFARLGGYYREYIKRLNTIGEFVIKMKTNIHSSQDAFKFIDKLNEFLVFTLAFLPTKVLFTHMDYEEYSEVLNYIKKLLAELQSYRESLVKMLSDDNLENVQFTGYDSRSISSKYYSNFFSSFQKHVLDRFVPFVSPYNQKNIGNKGLMITSPAAFFRITNQRAYPTLFELEKRRHFTFDNEKKEDYEREIQLIIKKHNKP